MRAQIEHKFLLVIFDGTTRLGEVLAVVILFISDRTIQQCLVCLKFLMNSMSGEELAEELISILSVTRGVESHRLLIVMRDRASINTPATRVISVMYPKRLDIGCLSHTLDHVGGNFKFQLSICFSTFGSRSFSQCKGEVTLETIYSSL